MSGARSASRQWLRDGTTVGSVHERYEESYLLEPARLFAALENGAPDLPPVVSPHKPIIAAAGTWGTYGSVIVLRRDEEETDALLDDVYILARSLDGRWQAPDRSSGSGMPEWVLDRPFEPLPDWQGSELVVLSAQLAHVAGRWVAELTVMASQAITTIEVRYGGETITVPVPASGLVTLPGVIHKVADTAEFRGFDHTGGLRAAQYYRPLTELDRSLGWPDESLWADEAH